MEIQLSEIYNKIIIDIRANYQYLQNRIPNSINIVENKILLNPEYYLNKNNVYVVYCDYGYRSRKVANYLNTKGYKVYSLKGGLQAYLNR